MIYSHTSVINLVEFIVIDFEYVLLQGEASSFHLGNCKPIPWGGQLASLRNKSGKIGRGWGRVRNGFETFRLAFHVFEEVRTRRIIRAGRGIPFPFVV